MVRQESRLRTGIRCLTSPGVCHAWSSERSLASPHLQRTLPPRAPCRSRTPPVARVAMLLPNWWHASTGTAPMPWMSATAVAGPGAIRKSSRSGFCGKRAGNPIESRMGLPRGRCASVLLRDHPRGTECWLSVPRHDTCATSIQGQSRNWRGVLSTHTFQ